MVILQSPCIKESWSFSNSSHYMASLSEDLIRSNEDMLVSCKSMLDHCGPNDDMWQKFMIPLTPPSSPLRTYGESSGDESTDDSCDIAERLQDVSDSLDTTFEADDYCNFSGLTEAINIRSKLISNCMWSGEEVRRINSYSSSISTTCKKLSIELNEDLFPTPCPSPPGSVNGDDGCPSSSDCVDPTTVFLLPVQSESSCPSSSDSESEEEIDVVTIDTKPLHLSVGMNRKRNNSECRIKSTFALSKPSRPFTAKFVSLPPPRTTSTLKTNILHQNNTTLKDACCWPKRKPAMPKATSTPRKTFPTTTVTSLRAFQTTKQTMPKSNTFIKTEYLPKKETSLLTSNSFAPITTPKDDASPILRKATNNLSDEEDADLEEKPSRKSLVMCADSDPDRRVNHNHLEKRRRIDLKNSFEKLRECVPTIENKDRSSKVVVLKQAADYIELLTKQDMQLEAKKILLVKEKKNTIIKLKRLLSKKGISTN